MLLTRPLNLLIDTTATTRPPAAAEPTAETAPSRRKTVDNILGRKKKRRLIQLVYEILGCPEEFYPNGVSRWEGKTGTIAVIHEYLGLQSGRARKQIRDVLRYVRDKTIQGEEDIDAGVRPFIMHVV